jgi:hypothetical protein
MFRNEGGKHTIGQTDNEGRHPGDGSDDHSEPLWRAITENERIESMDTHRDHEEERPILADLPQCP